MADVETKVLIPVPPKSLPSKPRLLGIFTGQGAQWARMGAELLATSPTVVSILDRLEQSLAELPDGPSWSIKDEILAVGEASRVNEAAISQPLCTAVQVILVDLLRSAGIEFEAVVGHSSGEMGAAYAAGYLSASDAIRIAYYRGYHLHLAQGPKGERGAMMAVGTSFNDAQELCDLRAFKGHISIAASNSSASVTLSGDLDAIEWAKDVLDDEKKFARLLKVDKAYHSHHMLACSDAYSKSLTACKIKVLRPPRNGTTWISSVYGEDAVEYRHKLNNEYWINNMASPVLFSQAVEFAAAERGPFDAAIECGPHPALKGPALQVIQEFLGDQVPYTGLLSRGKNDNEAFAEGLGFLWQALGELAVDYQSLDTFITGPGVSAPQILPNLPLYAWDHERIFWHESRQYAANRTKTDPSHELLGTKCPDGTEQQQRWRNMLRPQEIPWLAGHQIQGQMVFPAAGYVSAALEAVKLATRGQSITTIEIEDFVIGQAITFNDEYASVETQVTLTDIVTSHDLWSATFSFYSASTKHALGMDLNASGKISVILGEANEDVLPPNPGPEFNMIDIDPERFYESLSKLGFGYTGPFKALGSLHRRMGIATGTIRNPTSTDPAYNLLLHPATFDNAIQSIILAYCYPNDGRLWSVHLPTGIKKIRINPLLCETSAGKEVLLCFRSTITSERSTEIEGDVDIYDEQGVNALMQLEGMHTKPLAHATATNDSPLFLETIWDIAAPSRELAATHRPDLQSQAELCFDIERVAFYYLRHLDDVATRVDREKAEQHHKIFFEYIDHSVASVKSGIAQFAKREWMYDTYEQVQAIVRKYPESIDMKLMHAVGEHLVPVVRGETTMLEYMREGNILNDFYVHAVGFNEYTESLAQQVTQFGHRYPHMNVLEIGAGTGGATKRIFKKLGKKFGSYTYTDISTGFFEKAKEVFEEFESKMTFKALNIEKDPIEQGFAEHSYDLIVASLVLHATHEMEVTMRNVRSLLKPGGYLIMLELGDYIEMRTGLIFGCLSGWWMGYNDGRKLSPCMPEEDWDVRMKKVGFSGVDAIVPRQSDLPISLAVITSQAVDDHVNFLREPLAPGSLETVGSHLTIVGGSTTGVARLVDATANKLKHFYTYITRVRSLSELNTIEVPFMGTVLCLTDLDKPFLQDLKAEDLKGAQQLFKQSRTCLWVTKGSRDDDPYQNMSVGLGRVVKLEMTHLRLQSLDFDSTSEPTADIIATKLLQFEVTELWEQKGEAKNLLWSVEFEIAFEKGNFVIPRLVTSPARNGRYNSSRRLITRDMDPKSNTLGLRWSGKAYEVFEEAPESLGTAFDGRVELQVSHSTLEAIRVTRTDYAYLVLGTNLRTKEQVFALVSERHSVVKVFDSWTVPYNLAKDDALRLMPAVQNHLMALATIADFSSGETLILFEPKKEFADLLSRLATEKGIRVVNVTTRTDVKGSNWVSMHPNAPRRVIQSALPRVASCLIICSTQNGLAANVLACLPPNCKIQGTDFFTSKAPKLDSFSSMAFIPSTLRSAFVRAYHDAKDFGSTLSVIAASDIALDNQPTAETTLFSWASTDTVPVRVTPIDAGPLFSPEKTYWLVGLTGGLGLSLCEWMVKRGAKHVVLTSRNPKVDPRWEEHMKAQGAVVKIYSNDITNRESVRAVYKTICDNLPPIGGIAQGAMVLADTMFVDLDFERVQKVVGPKVKGSMHLEELFANTRLEFFVFFSSMAYVTGNQGQSVYAAANAYMTALAAQRRKRGLAGSAINIGTIIGNGYVTRQLTTAQQEYLTHMGNVFMSEQDFHEIFAEAVVAGRETATDTPEIMTGLRLAHMDDADKVTWFYNPKFSHCVLWPEAQGAKAAMSKQNVTVRAQLLLAATIDEVKEVIEDCFVAKLKSSLQIDPSVSILHMDAEELGLDSLVAVDIRSWFIKELNVEMPVLKILGGFTVAELVAAAQEKLPESFVPNLGKEIDPTLKAAARTSVEDTTAVPEKKPATTNERDFTVYEEDEEDEEDAVDASPPNLASIDESTKLANRRYQPSTSEYLSAKFNSTMSKPKGVVFSTTPMTPSSEVESIAKSKGSSSDSPFDSDSENDSLRKSMFSTATSLSMMDEYFSKDDAVLERVVPMSFGQARFWFLKFYLDNQTTFNITTSIRMDGHLNVENFAAAVRAVGRRHEALRTTFFTGKNNQPMQGVLREPVLHLEYKRIRGEEEIAVEYARIKNHHYNIGRGETMKIALLSLSEKLHQLIIGYHHINMDGISLEVIIGDLQKFYYRQPLAPVAVQYPEFSQIQHKEHSTGQWDNEIAFWKSEFADIPAPLPILPMSARTVRSSLTKYASNTVKFKIDSAVSTQIQNACNRTKTSPFNFYLAAFKALLYRHVGDEQTDICIGMADGGRNSELVSESVGFFLNLLPLRFKLQPLQTFNEALKEARSRVVAALANSKVPFDVLLNEVNAPRAPTHNPLFQAFINYRQGVQDKRKYCGCESEADQFDGSQTAYDISIDILANPGAESVVYFAGQSELYTQADVEILAQSYHNLLKAFAKNPASRLGRPPLYDPEATQKALGLGRGPALAGTWPETLVHRVDDMVKAHGLKVALKSPQGRLTYDQMAERVNAMASALKSNGLSKGARIGVFQDPTTDFFCSLLAILRIGAIFLPLEPRLTTPRLAVMVEDSELDAIVYDKANQKDLAALGSRFKKINVSLVLAKSSAVVPNHAEPEATAVILYTSGSTGKPKGILLSHASWCNQIQSSSQVWHVNAGTGVHLQHSAWSFDISISQTFVALANGASLFIVPKNKRGDSLAISKIIVSEEVNYVQATPSELVSWLHYADTAALRGSKWQFAMSGGEGMTPALIHEFRKLAKKDLRLVNAYGPAEIALAIGSAEVNYEAEDSTDQPFRLFPNYCVYIFDAEMKPVPPGIPGEICIGGAGVAQGYLNNDALNEERFLADDFAPAEYISKNWVKMHRSGDCGRLSADGGVILEGRVGGDTQIKLRGIRIDLRDIESSIIQQANSAIREGVVSVRTSGEAEYLVAHVVMSINFDGNREVLLERLRTSLPLPQYMQPATIIPLERLPTNYSGKIDRKAIANLPLPPTTKENVRLPQPTKAPGTKLKEIWQQVLGDEITSLHQIDSESDFFHVGGSSLALVKVQALVKTAFNVEIPLVHLFENSTLGEMARKIDPTSSNSVQVETAPVNIPTATVLETVPTAPVISASQIDWERETALTDD
ncbi:polyketide synthetase, partial [Cenococcum geophilum]